MEESLEYLGARECTPNDDDHWAEGGLEVETLSRHYRKTDRQSQTRGNFLYKFIGKPWVLNNGSNKWVTFDDVWPLISCKEKLTPKACRRVRPQFNQPITRHRLRVGNDKRNANSSRQGVSPPEFHHSDHTLTCFVFNFKLSYYFHFSLNNIE